MNLYEFDEFSFSVTVRLKLVVQSEISETPGFTCRCSVNIWVCCLCDLHRKKTTANPVHHKPQATLHLW